MITKKELKEIVKSHERWLKTRYSIRTIGQRANFNDQDLSGLDFSGIQLQCASFIRTKLCGIDCCDANLAGSDFSLAFLDGVNFDRADLSNVHFTDASIIHTIFTGASLTETRFTGATLTDVVLDYSAFPLWCGSFDMNVDKAIFSQLAYHLCRLKIKDKECKEAQKQLKKIANTFHRVRECGEIK